MNENDKILGDIYFRLYDFLSVNLNQEQNSTQVSNKIENQMLENIKNIIQYEFNNLIIFNTKLFIEYILETYKNREQIWYQLSLDVDRCNVYINDKNVRNVESFKNVCTVNEDLYINDYSFKDIIALLCNQSSYVFAYILLHVKYCDIDKNVVLINSAKSRNIRITTCSRITLNYEFVLKVKDVTSNTKLMTIFCNMFIDLESDESVLVFNII